MAVTDRFLGFKIKDVMTAKVVTFSTSLTLTDAIQQILDHRISGAPVINESGEYVGVLSKTDLVTQKVIDYLKANNDSVTVGEVIKPSQLVMIDQEKFVEEAAEEMLNHHVHRIFVSENQKLVGVLSSYDVMKVLATCSEMRDLEAKLEIQFTGSGE